LKLNFQSSLCTEARIEYSAVSEENTLSESGNLILMLRAQAANGLRI
jgi:hypothetical protein